MCDLNSDDNMRGVITGDIVVDWVYNVIELLSAGSRQKLCILDGFKAPFEQRV